MGQSVILGLRPEQIYHPHHRASDIQPLPVKAQVEAVEHLGHGAIAHFTLLDGTDFVARLDPRAALVVGESLELLFDAQGLHLFDQASKSRL
ncbi:MAG: TOBE domain-containing protein [Synechococcales cyanobacterium RM1_1_8]|nr:TOBE domain-containing protein [Synechococcales cyanobacterium RM1_1_8]